MQSKGFAYKDQLRPVLEFLEEVDRSSDDGKFPASEEAVQELVEKQVWQRSRLIHTESGEHLLKNA